MYMYQLYVLYRLYVVLHNIFVLNHVDRSNYVHVYVNVLVYLQWGVVNDMDLSCVCMGVTVIVCMLGIVI